jgi:hypothetical protein
MFKIGDKVRKPKGYAFDGIIVSIFENTSGEIRIVAELEGNGMLHIFSPSQLELRQLLAEDYFKLHQEMENKQETLKKVEENIDREEWIHFFKNNSKEEILEYLIKYKFPL